MLTKQYSAYRYVSVVIWQIKLYWMSESLTQIRLQASLKDNI
jgi:hypothetical protein